MTPASLQSPQALRIAGAGDAEIAAQCRRFGLALAVDELRRIAARLERDPTLVEVYAFDAQWSEHCSYKSSRMFLERLPTEGPTVVQGPAEDAGILHLGEWQGKKYGIVIAHESHNHPSQVVPFEGAATGIGGIVRDVLCMGATVIAVADPLRFGTSDHARSIAEGVIDGIASYGNAIGVPNIAGDIYFDAGFDDNCLVNVVALGLVEHGDIIHSCAPPDADGWDIVLVGKATDRSGFGGAAFSSLTLDAGDRDANKGAVQVPDPFLKNVLMRASYRVFELLRAEKIAAGFKDLGAGGVLGCTAELASSGGFGAVVDLDLVSTSQADLPPAVIAVGETQERLAWVLPPHVTPRVLAIYNEEFGLPEVARGAGAAVVGTIAREQDYVLRHAGAEVMRVPIDFLTGGVRYARAYDEKPLARSSDSPADVDVGTALPRVLAHRDVRSRREVVERYDRVVRGTTVIPAGYGDAGVIAPVAGSPLGVALSVDGNPRYGKIDARAAAELAVCEAVRNVVCVGAKPAGLTDCLNFGNPERRDHMSDFVAAVEGLRTAALELGTPYVSGNVSLYNEGTSGRAVPPSAIVACVGALADISLAVTFALKEIGSPLYLLGQRSDELGGSALADLTGTGKALVWPDYGALRCEIAALLDAFAAGCVLAAHDVSDGGLLTTVAEMALGGDGRNAVGARLASHAGWAPNCGAAGAYFGEAGGFVIEVRRDGGADFLAACRKHGALPHALGETIAQPCVIVSGTTFSFEQLRGAWMA